MSNVRVIAQWRYGNDVRTHDIVTSHALGALTGLDHAMPVETIADMLQSPNDVHRASAVQWSWWTIVQVWAYDRRPAGEILAESKRHDVTPAGQSPQDHAYPFTCSYGCKCGAFPLGANYNQNLATQG